MALLMVIRITFRNENAIKNYIKAAFNLSTLDN